MKIRNSLKSLKSRHRDCRVIRRRGRTYVAATGVRVLALSGPPGPGEGWSATLALTRSQALELIGAEGGAREIRLLPRP